MESEAAVGLIKAIQIPLQLLTALHLTGPLWPPRRTVKNETCFDYIVIGAGTAGSVVANRLTENANNTVLVLEAGGDPPISSLIPILFVTEPRTPLDWNYTSTFDSYAANAQNNFTTLTAGKMLGGSSSLDHFIDVRGAVHDYDSWATNLNDPTWNYENMLPYFKKSENLKDPEILNSRFAVFHGTDGYMGITREPSKDADVYLDSFAEAGKPVLLDLNGNETIGYTQSTVIVTNGVRQSTAYAYLRPIRKRQNLYILRFTLATRIIFDENRRAIAVVAVRRNKTYVFRASKEIILCAGVYNSPQLLMLSGIGHREHLESFGINVVADLPVGDNFQDQVAVSLVFRTAVSIIPPPLPPLTKVPFPILVGLVALNKIQTYADYQVFALIFPHDTPYILLTCAVIFPYKPEICDKINNENKGRNSLYGLLTLTRPESRGTVRLSSSNPFDDPKITTGYYTEDTDLDNMVKYVKDYIKIGNTSYFQQVGAELIDLELPECSSYIYGSDEFWRCYILHTTVSPYHSTSTCSMGNVVDTRLRVFDVINLRVVDASIMPNLTSGSPFADVVMIAEKASDFIKEDSDKNQTCAELQSNAAASEGACIESDNLSNTEVNNNNDNNNFSETNKPLSHFIDNNACNNDECDFECGCN